MSKTFALPGLRIGWLACRDRELLARMRGDQGLHDDLQQRPERDPGPIALRRRDDGRGPQPRHRRRQPPAAGRVLRALGGRLRLGPPARRGDRLPAAAGRHADRRLRARAGRRGGRAPAPRLDLRAPGQPLPHRLRAAQHARGARAPGALRERPRSSAARRCASAARPRSTARARARRARPDRAWW